MAEIQPLLHTQSTFSSSSTNVCNPTDPDNEHYVRLCPHQILSFDTFQRFANLPGMKAGDNFDVFPEPHRQATQFRLSSGRCSVRNWEIDVDFVASACLKYKAGNAPEQLGDMVLHVDWQCFLGSFPFCKDQKSRKSLRRTLERPKIWLRPHMNLGDEYFVDVTYNFLHPVKTTCPLERHVVSQRGNPKRWCEQCDTLVRMSMDKSWCGPTIWYQTSRWLGLGKSADDPVWVQQCALRQNESRVSQVDQGS